MLCCAVNSLSGKNIRIWLLVDCSLPCLLVPFALVILIICTLHTALGRTLTRTHTACMQARNIHEFVSVSSSSSCSSHSKQPAKYTKCLGSFFFQFCVWHFWNSWLAHLLHTKFVLLARQGKARQVKAAATHNTILKCEKLNFRSNCNYMYTLVCLCHQFPMAVCTTIRAKAKES